MCVCMHACMYVCMYVCMHACMHACMHVFMYVCMYACMHACMYTYIMLTHVNPRLRHQWLLNGCRWSSWLISSQQQPLQFTSRWDMLGRTDQVPLIERASEIVLACHADVSRDPWFLVLGPTIFQLVGSCRSPRGKGKPTNKCIQMWQTNGFFRTWSLNAGTSISVIIKQQVNMLGSMCSIFDPCLPTEIAWSSQIGCAG